MRYPNPHPRIISVDVVIFTVIDGALNVLLIKRSRAPYKNVWALPGGFVNKNETIQGAANRVLRDKAGIRNVFIEQLYTFDSSGRDPRGSIPTVAYFALTPSAKIKIGRGKNSQQPAFHPVKKLPLLAFDHKNIIGYAGKRLRAKLEYTNAAYSLLPRYFTFYQLQKIYETIWGRSLDKRNFRKKVIVLDLIRPTGRVLGGLRQRPAALYEFKNNKLSELKKFIRSSKDPLSG